jgi:hypothetical protein
MTSLVFARLRRVLRDCITCDYLRDVRCTTRLWGEDKLADKPSVSVVKSSAIF